ncbi:MAG: hypothetical protein ABIP48_16250 [Planctomycetota bacterium]
MSQNVTRCSHRSGARACEAGRVLAMMLVAGAVLLGTSPAYACTTPVYRYAMYNWAPAPYFVFYFHRGEPPEEDAKLNQMIAELAETPPAVANVRFEAVDVAEADLDRLPEPVVEAWRSHVGEEADKAEPVHLVFTSWGAKLHVGRLDAETVRAMVASPARTRLGELLQEGNASVLVMLPGSDAAENERAEKVALELIAQAKSGEIAVESGFPEPDPSQLLPPAQTAGEAPAEDAPRVEEPPSPGGVKVELLKLARSDATEKWLIQSLTVMEPDLEELADQPMIFFAYGRGRAMPPYVGKGVTIDNLIGELQFLGSACSCFVKEQNPGADLLMQWDWEATADAMAANDPTLTGDPFAYQEFSPEEMGASAPAAESEAVAQVAPNDGDPPAEADSTAEEPQDGGGHSADVVAAQDRDPPVAAHARETATGPSDGSSGSFAGRQMWTFGIGLVVVTAVVVFAGMLLVLRRSCHPSDFF